MDERFNAVSTGRSYLCPVCQRPESMVQNERERRLFRCTGCYARFQFEPGPAGFESFLRIREPREVERATPDELAAKRARFLG